MVAVGDVASSVIRGGRGALWGGGALPDENALSSTLSLTFPT